jgi:hypothetical protein
MLPGVLYARVAGAGMRALEFWGAAPASTARISASAVPVRMLDRVLGMNAYSVTELRSRRASTAPHRDVKRDISS